MTALAALLLLAAAAASGISPLLTVVGAWAALIACLLALINAYRDSLEGEPVPDVVIAKIQRHRVIRVHPKKETS